MTVRRSILLANPEFFTGKGKDSGTVHSSGSA
jgi:hypothetical protein